MEELNIQLIANKCINENGEITLSTSECAKECKVSEEIIQRVFKKLGYVYIYKKWSKYYAK